MYRMLVIYILLAILWIVICYFKYKIDKKQKEIEKIARKSLKISFFVGKKYLADIKSDNDIQDKPKNN